MITIFTPSTHDNRRAANHLLTFSWIFMTAGALALIYVGYIIAESRAYERRALLKIESAKTMSSVDVPSPSLPATRPNIGDVLGEIEIPRLGLKTVVVEGASPRVLRHAIGHVSRTAFPWESGNVALAGHRDTLFRSLREIRPGDKILFKTPDQEFEYQVQATQVVRRNDIGVLKPSESGQLTLITCFPFNYIGPAPHRFVVLAKAITKAP